jgi:hypothetical protein
MSVSLRTSVFQFTCIDMPTHPTYFALNVRSMTDCVTILAMHSFGTVVGWRSGGDYVIFFFRLRFAKSEPHAIVSPR